jgi:hypothetical protein
MSRKSVSVTMSVLGRSLLALGFVIAAAQSCGGGSSSDPVALCNQLCNKGVSCELDGGAEPAASMTQCMTSCMAAAHCSNQSQLVSAANACLAKPACADFVACTAVLPDCQSTTGSGGAGAAMGGTNGGGAGTNGSGGSTGSGGMGAASCASCDKAATCCAAIAALAGGSAADCTAYSTSMCSTAGQDMAAEASACSQILAGGAAANVAACK